MLSCTVTSVQSMFFWLDFNLLYLVNNNSIPNKLIFFKELLQQFALNKAAEVNT